MNVPLSFQLTWLKKYEKSSCFLGNEFIDDDDEVGSWHDVVLLIRYASFPLCIVLCQHANTCLTNTYSFILFSIYKTFLLSSDQTCYFFPFLNQQRPATAAVKLNMYLAFKPVPHSHSFFLPLRFSFLIQ